MEYGGILLTGPTLKSTLLYTINPMEYGGILLTGPTLKSTLLYIIGRKYPLLLAWAK